MQCLYNWVKYNGYLALQNGVPRFGWYAKRVSAGDELHVEAFTGVQIYLDDILVATRVPEECHWHKFQTVLNVLNTKNAAVVWSKCTFFVQEIEWLGFRLSNKGTVPLERKVESIVNMKNLENNIDIRSLIVSINHFSRFIPNLAETTKPFRKLMKKHSSFE